MQIENHKLTFKPNLALRLHVQKKKKPTLPKTTNSNNQLWGSKQQNVDMRKIVCLSLAHVGTAGWWWPGGVGMFPFFYSFMDLFV